MKKNFQCQICNVAFERYVAPSDKKQDRNFCSRSCQMKFTRGSFGASGFVSTPCEECAQPINKYSKASRPLRFCSKSRASKNCCKKGMNVFSGNELRLRLGTATQAMIDDETKVRIRNTVERNTGKTLSPETRAKIATSCTGISNAIKGKTFEEFYGPERARMLSNNHSLKLKQGFREGKIRPSARTKNAPTYKGVRLRSKLELTVIQLLEATGLSLNETLLYEDKKTIVQWVDSLGDVHSYTPDLHDLVNRIVYEVKPTWLIEMPTDEMQRKMTALAAAGFLCAYISEQKVISC